MPSIPQSLLWISLVVLWLFVLVPMLVSKRDAVRRTSDVALATRVLNSGTAARLIKRGGPAAGHRSDPDWQPEEDEYDDDWTTSMTTRRGRGRRRRAVARGGHRFRRGGRRGCRPRLSRVRGGRPGLGSAAGQRSADVDDETAEDTDTEVDLAVEYDDEGEAFDDDADEYEYIDDTSGIPVGEEPPRTPRRRSDRRHRYDPDKAAAVVARKYAVRKRVLMIMALTLVLSAATAFLLTSAAWWFFSVASAVTVLYLGYLRRQTRIEERVRRRRMQRMARSQLGVENTYDREYDVVPSRLRRPGRRGAGDRRRRPDLRASRLRAVCRRDYDWDLPRAVGQ